MVGLWLMMGSIFLLISATLWIFFDVSIVAIFGGFLFLLGLNMIYPPIFIWNGWYLGYPGPEDAIWVLIIMRLSRLFRLSKIKAIFLSIGTWFFWKSVIATLFVKWGESMMGLDPKFRTWILDKVAGIEIFGISLNFLLGVIVAIPALYLIIREWMKPW